MDSAVLFHSKGLTERSNCANQPSTAFSHEALVGVKCSLKRGCFSSHCLMAGVVCVEQLSRITCSSKSAGVTRSICRRKARNYLARWRWVIRPTTWQVRMSKAAYRLAGLWRLNHACVARSGLGVFWSVYLHVFLIIELNAQVPLTLGLVRLRILDGTATQTMLRTLEISAII